MLSSELELCLNPAFQAAREARHEYMTVEHLLLSIMDTPSIREILKACGADAGSLRRELEGFVADSTPRLGTEDDREVQPTLGFQRVLQRAVFHVQSSGKPEVTVANVLVALFERAYLLVYDEHMPEQIRRLWQSWEDYMREWCRRPEFRALLPELLQNHLTAEEVVAEALPLLQSQQARQTMLEGYGRLRQALGEPGVTRRAAAAILDALPSRSA